MKKQTTKEVLADREYWNEITKHLPWKLYGWTYKNQATFLTYGEFRYYTMEINSEQYDQILNTLKGVKVTYDHR